MRSEKLRYEMTVEVEAPNGVRTSSAVREVVYREGYQGASLSEDRGAVSVKGEAVAIDLPNGHTLFALLTAPGGDVDYGARIFDRAFDWHPSFAEQAPSDPRVRTH